MSVTINTITRRRAEFRYTAEVILPETWDLSKTYDCVNALDEWCINNIGGYQRDWIIDKLRKGRTLGRVWTGGFSNKELRDKFVASAKQVVMVTRLTS